MLVIVGSLQINVQSAKVVTTSGSKKYYGDDGASYKNQGLGVAPGG